MRIPPIVKTVAVVVVIVIAINLASAYMARRAAAEDIASSGGATG